MRRAFETTPFEPEPNHPQEDHNAAYDPDRLLVGRLHSNHNQKHATAVFPDAIRWIWKDWPQPAKAGQTKNQALTDILIAGQGWQLVSEGYRYTEGLAANARGEVFFTDTPAGKSYKIGVDGKASVFVDGPKRSSGQAFGPDGRLYAVLPGESKVVVHDAKGKASTIAEGFVGNDIVVAHNGNIYVTNPPASVSNDPSKVWLIKPTGEKRVVDTGLSYASGVTLSPDQSLLYVADYRSHWIFSYQIQADGTLQYKQRYYWLHESDAADSSLAQGMRVDRDGRLYVATPLGIQVCDQAGRVNAIIPTPNGKVSNLAFGGENFDTLFATCVDKVYRRKLKVKGAQAWDAPNKPAAPRL